jgi:predicted ATPase/transcriptional regulator with XRE-family HTH domain
VRATLVAEVSVLSGESSTLAEQLRLFRSHAGLTQEMLADRAGVSPATIAALEQGVRRRPYRHTLAALARALGLQPADEASLIASADGSSGQARATSRWAAPPIADRVYARVRMPEPPTALIGRETELAAASSLLRTSGPGTRLLTFVGPGGVGKTRLALAVALAVVDSYADGVVFVDLAPLHEYRLVPAAVASALRVAGAGDQTATDLVIEALRDQRLLLVLDNFEHLLGGVQFVGQLLAECPRLTLLATSRTALRLRAERRFAVEALAQPPNEQPGIEAIAAAPAVRLFVERARDIAPDFVLDVGNAHTVAAICRRLDGMPLAIELAAARVGLLGPRGLLGRLDRGLSVLASGAPDLPERQRTLRSTLTWSHDLLGVPQQQLFRRLAVFAGGWTLTAAEAVCGGGDDLAADDVLGLLGVLVDNSLIRRVDVAQDEPGFGMLETVREYAEERLVNSGELDALRGRHRDWCLRLVEQAAPELIGPLQATWLDRLERALDNLRATLGWVYEQEQTECGLRLAGSLGRFWLTRRYVGEGRDWLERLLGSPTAIRAPADVRAQASYAAGVLANIQGDQTMAVLRLEQSIEQYHLAGDTVGAVRALNTRGGVAYDQGLLAFAAALWEQSLAQARAAGDLGEAAHALGNLGEAHFHMGDLAGAATRHAEALALARQAGRTDLEAMQLGNLGNVARQQGDLGRATALQRQALGLKLHLGARRQIAITLEDLASIAGMEDRATRAASLLGAASAVRELIGTPQPVPERVATDRAVAQAREAIGDEVWSAAFAAGRELPIDQTIAFALE